MKPTDFTSRVGKYTGHGHQQVLAWNSALDAFLDEATVALDEASVDTLKELRDKLFVQERNERE